MAGNNNPYFAGVPQNKRTQVGTTQIGQVDYFNFPSLGQYVDYDDGTGNITTYLRSGMFAPARLYPIAAKLRHLWAVGTPTGILPASTAYTGMAVNNSGGIVAAFGDATNVHVSTDYGATWTAVAHNAGGAVYDVVWDATNSLFITAGNSAAVFYTSSSPTGATFTVRTGSAITGGTANTARIATYNGSTVMVCVGSTTGGASLSTNGTTWAAKNLSQALVTAAFVAHNGNATWLCAGTGSTACNTSADGSTWASATGPSGSATQMNGGGGIFAMMAGTAGQTWTSTTGATSSWKVIQSAFPTIGQTTASAIPSTAGCALRFWGGYFNWCDSTTAEWLYTTDFVTYIRKGISSGAASQMCHGSSDRTNVVFLPLSAATVGGYTIRGTTADNVGIVVSFSSTGNTTERLYTRIA